MSWDESGRQFNSNNARIGTAQAPEVPPAPRRERCLPPPMIHVRQFMGRWSSKCSTELC